ncbi:MAG: hypothetical protein ABS58_12100 [Mesorhizobium sp. SCN 65-20]|nr:MAG: hypothetical protein ABS58_12100 [Mesorhizobium sp. SCN 65-20]
MKDDRRTNSNAAKLAVNMRRELASQTNLRVLESMPAFKAEAELPARLRRLLAKLTEIEARPSRR